MNNCLNCQKPLKHIEGRRKKKFCDEKCKGEYWRKEKGSNYKPKRKHLTAEQYEELVARIVENNKPENKKKILEERNNSVEKQFEQPLTIQEAAPSEKIRQEMQAKFQRMKEEFKNKNK